MIDALEGAVSKSALVLVCYSDGYKRSANCRSEAEYAFRKKPMLFVRVEEGYRADGWLAFMMGQALYYDLAKNPSVSAVLIKHVKQLYEGKEITDAPTAAPAAGPAPPAAASKGHSVAAAPSAAAAAPQKELECNKWTVQQVEKWVQEKGLKFLLESYVSRALEIYFFPSFSAQIR